MFSIFSEHLLGRTPTDDCSCEYTNDFIKRAVDRRWDSIIQEISITLIEQFNKDYLNLINSLKLLVDCVIISCDRVNIFSGLRITSLKNPPPPLNCWHFCSECYHKDAKYIYLEAATRGVPCTKVFLEISQNSQENTCARISFLIKLRAFPVNFVKFLRTAFLQNTFGRLLLFIRQKKFFMSYFKETKYNKSKYNKFRFIKLRKW